MPLGPDSTFDGLTQWRTLNSVASVAPAKGAIHRARDIVASGSVLADNARRLMTTKTTTSWRCWKHYGVLRSDTGPGASASFATVRAISLSGP